MTQRARSRSAPRMSRATLLSPEKKPNPRPEEEARPAHKDKLHQKQRPRLALHSALSPAPVLLWDVAPRRLLAPQKTARSISQVRAEGRSVTLTPLVLARPNGDNERTSRELHQGTRKPEGLALLLTEQGHHGGDRELQSFASGS